MLAVYCVLYSYGYVATATHFGLMTVWETGSLNMRHQCKHNVSVLNFGFL